MSDISTTEARHAFQQLLAGTPNGASADKLGAWWPTYERLKAAYDDQGESGLRDAWNLAVSTRDGKGLAQLLAATEVKAPSFSMPPLPSEALQIYQHRAPCAAWLDQYITFASKTAPITPPSFHEAAGLFLVSIALARRLVLLFRGGQLFPNIYALFIAPSGYGKTVSFDTMHRVIKATGMKHLLVTEQMTPENLITQLSTSVPATLSKWEREAQDQWLKERAFAAQRGWAVDEASFLFDSFSREYMTGIMGLLLKYYDCPEDPARENQGGGRTIVHNAALSFFGSTTPVGMRAHLQNELLWANGLFARFAMIIPEHAPIWVDDDETGEIPLPPTMIDRLRHIYRMFPEPMALLNEDDKGNKSVEVVGTSEPTCVALDPGVYKAWQIYRKATYHTIGATSTTLDEALRANYNRFAAMAMKVAMLLATMDSETPHVRVSLAHFARAQEIVERWRASVHRVWSQEVKVDEQKIADRALQRIVTEPAGLTARQLMQMLNKESKIVYPALQMLEESGLVEQVKVGRKTLWKVSSCKEV